MHQTAQQIITDLENDLSLTAEERVPSGQLATLSEEVAQSVHDNSKGFQRLAAGLSVAQRMGNTVSSLGSSTTVGTFLGVGALAGVAAVASHFGADISHLYDPYILNGATVGFVSGGTALLAGGGISGAANGASKLNQYNSELKNAMTRIREGASPVHDDWQKRLSYPEMKIFSEINKKIEEIERQNPEAVDTNRFKEVLVSAIQAVEDNRALTSNAHQIEELLKGAEKEVNLGFENLQRELRLEQGLHQAQRNEDTVLDTENGPMSVASSPSL